MQLRLSDSMVREFETSGGKHMSKAVSIKNGQTTFLIETDPSVQMPPEMTIAIASTIPGIPKDMQPVVSMESLEGNFTQISELIVACSNSLFDAITKIRKPDKVTVEFGIKLAGEGGVPMLTKASGEASFQISVEWTSSSIG